MAEAIDLWKGGVFLIDIWAETTHIEFDVLICDGFNVETDSWNSGDRLIEFKLVQNS